MVCEEVSFEEFQDGHGGHGYRNETILCNSESVCRSDAAHEVSAQSDMVWEEMSFEEFQDGRRGSQLGYLNGTILAILNLYVTLTRTPTPIKFRLNRIYGLGGDVI